MQAASGDDNDQVVIDPDHTVSGGNGGWSKQFNGILVDDDDGHYFY